MAVHEPPQQIVAFFALVRPYVHDGKPVIPRHDDDRVDEIEIVGARENI